LRAPEAAQAVTMRSKSLASDLTHRAIHSGAYC
jgi:hypothetical protein